MFTEIKFLEQQEIENGSQTQYKNLEQHRCKSTGNLLLKNKKSRKLGKVLCLIKSFFFYPLLVLKYLLCSWDFFLISRGRLGYPNHTIKCSLQRNSIQIDEKSAQQGIQNHRAACCLWYPSIKIFFFSKNSQYQRSHILKVTWNQKPERKCLAENVLASF